MVSPNATQCRDLIRLVEAYAVRCRKYAEAVARLGHSTASKDSFQRILASAERQRSICDEARLELRQHLMQHHCEKSHEREVGEALEDRIGSDGTRGRGSLKGLNEPGNFTGNARIDEGATGENFIDALRAPWVPIGAIRAARAACR